MSDKMRRCLIGVLLLVFCISAVFFGKSLWSYREGDKIYESALGFVEAEEIDECHEITVQKVEDEHFFTVNHEMTKTHFISFIAYLTSDRIQFVKLYPEGNAETRFQLRGRGYVYIYCNKHGLMKRKV